MGFNDLCVLGGRLSSLLALEPDRSVPPPPRRGLAAIAMLSSEPMHFTAYGLALAWGQTRSSGSWALIERLSSLTINDHFNLERGPLAVFRRLTADKWQTWDEADQFISWCRTEEIETHIPLALPLLIGAIEIHFTMSPELLADADAECLLLMGYSVQNPSTAAAGDATFEELVSAHFA